MLQLPTITQLTSSALNKMLAALDTTASTLEKAFLRVLASVLAGAHTTLWKYSGFSLLQQHARTATFEEITVNGETFSPLRRIGARVLVGDPNPATASRLACTATILADGGQLRAGVRLVDGNTGVVYAVELAVDITGSPTPLTFQVISVSDPGGGQGLGGVGDSATQLEFVTPVPGLSRVVTVTSLVTAGQPAETEDSYRARVVEAEESPAEGGAAADYRRWGREADTVRQVYPYSGVSPMEVDVYVEGGEGPDYIPEPEVLALVVERIETDADGNPRRPLNDAVNVLPITRRGISVIITNYEGTETQQAEVESAIDARLRTLRPYLPAIDPLPRRDVVSSGDIGGIIAETVANQGLTVGTVTVEIDDEQIELYYLGRGELAKLEVVEW